MARSCRYRLLLHYMKTKSPLPRRRLQKKPLDCIGSGSGSWLPWPVRLFISISTSWWLRVLWLDESILSMKQPFPAHIWYRFTLDLTFPTTLSMTCSYDNLFFLHLHTSVFRYIFIVYFTTSTLLETTRQRVWDRDHDRDGVDIHCVFDTLLHPLVILTTARLDSAPY